MIVRSFYILVAILTLGLPIQPAEADILQQLRSARSAVASCYYGLIDVDPSSKYDVAYKVRHGRPVKFSDGQKARVFSHGQPEFVPSQLERDGVQPQTTDESLHITFENDVGAKSRIILSEPFYVKDFALAFYAFIDLNGRRYLRLLYRREGESLFRSMTAITEQKRPIVDDSFGLSFVPPQVNVELHRIADRREIRRLTPYQSEVSVWLTAATEVLDLHAKSGDSGYAYMSPEMIIAMNRDHVLRVLKLAQIHDGLRRGLVQRRTLLEVTDSGVRLKNSDDAPDLSQVISTHVEEDGRYEIFVVYSKNRRVIYEIHRPVGSQEGSIVNAVPARAQMTMLGFPSQHFTDFRELAESYRIRW